MVEKSIGLHFSTTLVVEFRKLKQLSEKAAERLDENEFSFRESENENSVKILVQHVAGNLISRFTDFFTTDGEKPWRNRDSEFEEQDISRKELMNKWESAWKILFTLLENLKEKELASVIKIRGEELTVVQALLRQLSHYGYHSGQIVQLAKKIKGERWESLSIPKGRSSEFMNNGKYLRG
ncbi:MAG: DUF1572 family protein [Bacteroidetes bacterium]|nr:DUF1572 family protein [Bacteroidota bacterium]